MSSLVTMTEAYSGGGTSRLQSLLPVRVSSSCSGAGAWIMGINDDHADKDKCFSNAIDNVCEGINSSPGSR